MFHAVSQQSIRSIGSTGAQEDESECFEPEELENLRLSQSLKARRGSASKAELNVLLDGASLKKPASAKASALWSYTPSHTTDIAVKKGEKITIYYRNGELVFAENSKGEQGFLPFNYCTLRRRSSLSESLMGSITNSKYGFMFNQKRNSTQSENSINKLGEKSHLSGSNINKSGETSRSSTPNSKASMASEKSSKPRRLYDKLFANRLKKVSKCTMPSPVPNDRKNSKKYQAKQPPTWMEYYQFDNNNEASSSSSDSSDEEMYIPPDLHGQILLDFELRRALTANIYATRSAFMPYGSLQLPFGNSGRGYYLEDADQRPRRRNRRTRRSRDLGETRHLSMLIPDQDAEEYLQIATSTAASNDYESERSQSMDYVSGFATIRKLNTSTPAKLVDAGYENDSVIDSETDRTPSEITTMSEDGDKIEIENDSLLTSSMEVDFTITPEGRRSSVTKDHLDTSEKESKVSDLEVESASISDSQTINHSNQTTESLISKDFDSKTNYAPTRPTTVPKAPLSSAQEMTVAYDFISLQETDLNVVAGEHVLVLKKQDKSWWWVRATDGREGLVPSNYLVPVGENTSNSYKTNLRFRELKLQHPLLGVLSVDAKSKPDPGSSRGLDKDRDDWDMNKESSYEKTSVTESEISDPECEQVTFQQNSDKSTEIFQLNGAPSSLIESDQGLSSDRLNKDGTIRPTVDNKNADKVVENRVNDNITAMCDVVTSNNAGISQRQIKTNAELSYDDLKPIRMSPRILPSLNSLINSSFDSASKEYNTADSSPPSLCRYIIGKRANRDNPGLTSSPESKEIMKQNINERWKNGILGECERIKVDRPALPSYDEIMTQRQQTSTNTMQNDRIEKLLAERDLARKSANNDLIDRLDNIEWNFSQDGITPKSRTNNEYDVYRTENGHIDSSSQYSKSVSQQADIVPTPQKTVVYTSTDSTVRFKDYKESRSILRPNSSLGAIVSRPVSSLKTCINDTKTVVKESGPLAGQRSKVTDRGHVPGHDSNLTVTDETPLERSRVESTAPTNKTVSDRSDLHAEHQLPNDKTDSAFVDKMREWQKWEKTNKSLSLRSDITTEVTQPQLRRCRSISGKPSLKKVRFCPTGSLSSGLNKLHDPVVTIHRYEVESVENEMYDPAGINGHRYSKVVKYNDSGEAQLATWC